MNYYKQTNDNFIIAIGTTSADPSNQITEEEYNELLSIIHSIPQAPSGFYYRLAVDKEWILEELPPIEEELLEEVD